MRLLHRLSPALVPVAALFALGGFVTHDYWAPDGVVIPAPATDIRAGGETTATVVVAGGCFWGVQAVFQHTKGVTSAVSGYAGGEAITAKYELVGSGLTGHAEAVKVTYDPRVISYGKILQIFFSVAHDPTEVDRQGPDVGTEYRTTIFPANAEQARVAKAYISQLDEARVWGSRIATTIEPGKTFYPAEAYHQDFLEHNRTYPYIVINDLPKLADLKRIFPRDYREDAVLVKP
jgi:peptide-methionine (S)-S-oxide reductase